MKSTYPILSIEAARSYEDSVLCSDKAMTDRAMHNAGKAIGEALYRDYREVREWPAVPKVMVLCGKGLNTGDALVACETLKGFLLGLRVELVMTSDVETFDALAGSALQSLRDLLGDDLIELGVDEYGTPSETKYDVIVDALYGLGFKPPLREEAASLLRFVNEQANALMRVSIDLPSGIGDSCEKDAFVADITYIPGVPKKPCFEKRNTDHVGRIRFLEVDPFVGDPESSEGGSAVVSPGIHTVLRRLRHARSDKRSFGHCLVLGGSNDMPGAVAMATMGALKGGAGLVTTAVPSPIIERLAGSIPESMWRSLPVQSGGGLDVESVRVASQLGSNADSFLIGPGLQMDRATTFAICRIVRETPLPLVVDASALTQDVMAAVLGRPLTAGPVVLTPHGGEFARISGQRSSSPSGEELRAFSQKFRVTTLLKGSPTWISDGKRVLALPVGGPVLARGGSGDILAGILTALLGQMPKDPLKAACIAASWHGAAADSLAREKGSVAVRTTELLHHLSASLR